jgi:hypothetical protein
VDGEPERMTGAAEDIRFFYYENQSKIFYFSPQGELFALAHNGGPSLIVENPVLVLFEVYELGGNLYILQNSAEMNTSVSIELRDPHAATDAIMREPRPPQQGGGSGIGGWIAGIIGSGGREEAEYRRQRDAWNAKIARDDVREAAHEALSNLPSGLAQMELHVYNGVSVERLAAGVAREGIVSVRVHGRPAALFDKMRVVAHGAQREVTLEVLQGHFEHNGTEAVREYISTMVAEHTESDGWRLVMMTATGPNEIPMGRTFATGADWKANFLQTPDAMLYLENNVAGSSFSMHVYELMDYGLSDRRFLGSGVTGAVIGRAGVYFLRQETVGQRTTTLYFYHGGQRGERMLGNVEAFFFAPGDRTLLVLHDVTDGIGMLSACTMEVARRVAQDVRFDSVRAGRSYAGYLANWQEGKGQLWLTNMNNRPAIMVDAGVTEILAVS